ncbi:hypothetical protein GE061_001058 [Apolygus lucorum]|uniref:Uncharacterized protein n=1 Tax=Apolygus lucorum TaxID=248454 RepID=A0A8S9Y7Y3_APOLU|nr:hypothetical protein GE061_001058 [Apolygus lucorum]
MIVIVRARDRWPSYYEDMDHNINDGTITIIKVVNPAIYWVRCSDCISTDEVQSVLEQVKLKHASNIQRGERLVLRFFGRHLYRVVVQDSAPIMLQGVLSYKVFLLDHLSTLIVAASQLYDGASDDFMDQVPQQHLIAVQNAAPVDCQNIGDQFDVEAQLELQKQDILSMLEDVDELHFQSREKSSLVTWGKLTIWTAGRKYNFLKYLVSASLAYYVSDSSKSIFMQDIIDSVTTEQNSIEELLSPLRARVLPKRVTMIPSPPSSDDLDDLDVKPVRPRKCNQRSTNSPDLPFRCILDKIIHYPSIETFKGMQEQYSRRLIKEAARTLKPGKDMRSMNDSPDVGPSPKVRGIIHNSSDEPTSENEGVSIALSSYKETDFEEDALEGYEPIRNSYHLESPDYSASSSDEISRNSSESVSQRMHLDREREIDDENHSSTAVLTYGRGTIFKKYLKSKQSTPLSTNYVAIGTDGQFDDAANASCTCCFADTDSEVNYLEGFLSNDEDEDDDVILR